MAVGAKTTLTDCGKQASEADWCWCSWRCVTVSRKERVEVDQEVSERRGGTTGVRSSLRKVVKRMGGWGGWRVKNATGG